MKIDIDPNADPSSVDEICKFINGLRKCGLNPRGYRLALPYDTLIRIEPINGDWKFEGNKAS